MENNNMHILNCVNDLANGGIEAFCLNINKNIDTNKFKIDYFLTLGKNEYHKDSIKELGGNIFNINNIKLRKHFMNKLKIFFSTINILKNNGPYNAVHIHNCKGMSSILLASWICRVPIRITHSHNAFYPKSKSFKLQTKIKIADIIRKIYINIFSTNKLGCSQEACKSMYGNKCFKDKRTEIIFNGIDLEKFNIKNYDKEELIKKYKVTKENINFINIGRYSEEKNQLFFIDIFYELSKKRNNVNLTIIGHGEMKAKIKEYITKLNLQDKIRLMPHDSCIPEVLSTMDYFILPSIHEGLGIVLIEAQAMGLHCFASNYVPEEAQVGLCNYINLEDGVNKWCENIDKYIENKNKRYIDKDKLFKYDIKAIVKRMEEIYIK